LTTNLAVNRLKSFDHNASENKTPVEQSVRGGALMHVTVLKLDLFHRSSGRPRHWLSFTPSYPAVIIQMTHTARHVYCYYFFVPW